MASKVKASTALFLSFNLLFFALVSSSAGPNVDVPSNAVGGTVDDLLNRSSSNGNGVVNVNDFLNGGNDTQGRCNPLKLGVCAKLLGGLVDVQLGNVPTQPCCSLIEGMVDLEATVCLCTSIRAKVLSIINLDVPVSLSLLLGNCGRNPAVDYQCTP